MRWYWLFRTSWKSNKETKKGKKKKSNKQKSQCDPNKHLYIHIKKKVWKEIRQDDHDSHTLR